LESARRSSLPPSVTPPFADATASTSNAATACSNGSGPAGSTNSHDTELRKLLRVDLLILDDFALQALDALDTADIYELIVERHRAAATVVTSNREPIEWLGIMADPLLAQSAIDRLQSAAHELVLDGESYR
jgi:DNA replication protein DnaC